MHRVIPLAQIDHTGRVPGLFPIIVLTMLSHSPDGIPLSAKKCVRFLAYATRDDVDGKAVSRFCRLLLTPSRARRPTASEGDALLHYRYIHRTALRTLKCAQTLNAVHSGNVSFRFGSSSFP